MRSIQRYVYIINLTYNNIVKFDFLYEIRQSSELFNVTEFSDFPKLNSVNISDSVDHVWLIHSFLPIVVRIQTSRIYEGDPPPPPSPFLF